MPTPAEVYLSETNGSAVVTDNISTMNFGGADIVDLVPADHPVVRPNGGAIAYSFQKWWRLKVNALNDSSLIQNTKFWKSAGALVTGETLYYNGSASVPYSGPVQTAVGNPTVVPTSEPSPNIPVNGSTFSGTITTSPTYSNGYTAVQMRINDGGVTPIGSVNQKTFVIQWDES